MLKLRDSIIFKIFKFIRRFFNNPELFIYAWLRIKLLTIPRFTEFSIKLHGWDLHIPDSISFLSAYKEIFWRKIYAFNFKDKSPIILDLGANIGLSILFFKKMYPEARIVAFEADPKIYECLKKNVHGNGYNDVELINKAIWSEKTILKFSPDGADGGRVIVAENQKVLEIETVAICEILENKKFDFIKMDIEGAEDVVLPACEKYLAEVNLLFVEYHSPVGGTQSLDKILNILLSSGFRIQIHNLVPEPSPFINWPVYNGFDLQLNIFARKEDNASTLSAEGGEEFRNRIEEVRGAQL